MLWFIKWYLVAGLLVVSLMALLFLPGKQIVPRSWKEFRNFLLCWLLWPWLILPYWGTNEK